MKEKHDMSEIDEIIKQALREQSTHPQGLNSSITHGSLYPVTTQKDGDKDLAAESDQNKTESSQEQSGEPISGSSKPLRMGIRRNWG